MYVGNYVAFNCLYDCLSHQSLRFLKPISDIFVFPGLEKYCFQSAAAEYSEQMNSKFDFMFE